MNRSGTQEHDSLDEQTHQQRQMREMGLYMNKGEQMQMATFTSEQIGGRQWEVNQIPHILETHFQKRGKRSNYKVRDKRTVTTLTKPGLVKQNLDKFA